MKKVARRGIFIALCLALPEAMAHRHVHQLADLADLSLEQLTQVTVTSASRREQPLGEAAASIFVITRDDIRRSGATSLPEALRLAPNLQVMRGDTSQYVVSARGGLTTTANKMLVLVDGRTIYTPLFSGVFYDALALSMEDVERIEVISGPGSTLWGTNAVNGVINVISRSARDTVGSAVALVAGDEERGVDVRHGRAAGGGAMRVFARYFDRDGHRLLSGAPALDDARRANAGVRGDWERGADSLSMNANAFKADINNLGGTREVKGANALGRWRRALGTDSEIWIQSYVARVERLHTGTFHETRDTFDVEGQRALRLGSHRLALGAGYRASRDDTAPHAALGFIPEDRTLSFASLYAQDEIALGPRAHLTAGLRAERNSYTGVEWLPTLRLSMNLAPRHFVWGAFTRTVRSPSRLDADLVVPGAPPFIVVSNPGFRSEVANVTELGYRANVSRTMTLSITAFHHRFSDLRTLEPTPGASTLMFSNAGLGRITGVEAWGDYRPSPAWRLAWGFTAMRDRTAVEPGHVNLAENALGNNPRRTASLRSQWNVTSTVELDLMLRYVSDLPNPAIGSYTQVNARIGWRAAPNLELSLVAVNALDREHSEFGAAGVRAVFDRALLAKAAWTF